MNIDRLKKVTALIEAHENNFAMNAWFIVYESEDRDSMVIDALGLGRMKQALTQYGVINGTANFDNLTCDTTMCIAGWAALCAMADGVPYDEDLSIYEAGRNYLEMVEDDSGELFHRTDLDYDQAVSWLNAIIARGSYIPGFIEEQQ